MSDPAAVETDYRALLLGVAEGERSALQALFEAEAPRMKGVARRMLRRDDLADEAVQDAFVRIWQKAAQYDGTRGSALGWVYTVLRSVALNKMRQARREDLTAPEDIDAVADLTAPPVSADDIWARMSAGSRLRACLSALDPAKRNAVLLAYAYGLTHGEIAGRAGLPLGTVKAWVRRGLLALRECME